MTRYGKIVETDTKEKKKSVQEPLDTLQPIYVFFKVINDRLRYAGEENTLLLTSQVL